MTFSFASPPDHDESGVRLEGPRKLIGYARVTNVGRQTCRPRGEVDTRLRDRNGELAISYSDDINDTAKQRITIVPPGQSAKLRLDGTGRSASPSTVRCNWRSPCQKAAAT